MAISGRNTREEDPGASVPSRLSPRWAATVYQGFSEHLSVTAPALCYITARTVGPQVTETWWERSLLDAADH